MARIYIYIATSEHRGHCGDLVGYSLPSPEPPPEEPSQSGFCTPAQKVPVRHRRGEMLLSEETDKTQVLLLLLVVGVGAVLLQFCWRVWGRQLLIQRNRLAAVMINQVANR